METLGHLSEKFRLYGVCGVCARMERLNILKLMHRLGADTPIGCLGPRLRCLGCGNRAAGIRIVWAGKTAFAYR